MIGILTSVGIISISVVILCYSWGLTSAQIIETPHAAIDKTFWNYVKLWGFLCICKHQKAIVFAARLKQIGLTLSISYHLMPFLANLFGMVAVIFFMFATLGINLMGGNVSSSMLKTYERIQGGSASEGYQYMNFNDFPNAILY